MLRSLFAGISGMRVNQTMLDVTGNNIANANTIGFKSSSTVFQDTLSQMLTASSAPSAQRGGTNPIQVGLGVQLATVSTNFTQGSNEVTGGSTDMMISGDGFFVVNDGSNQYYTRSGDFTFDNSGNLVAPDGKYVMGYSASGYTGYTAGTPGSAVSYDLASGTLGTGANGLDDAITVNFSDAANNVTVAIPANANASTTPRTNADIAAALNGNAGFHASFTATLADPTDDTSDIIITANKPYGTVAGTPLTVTGVGATSNVTDGTAAVAVDGDGNDEDGVAPTPFVEPTSTSYSGNLSLINLANNAGSLGPGITIQSYEIGSDGTVTGTYSDGSQLAIAKIAIANFANPDGLDKAGDTQYAQSSNSGQAAIGVAGQSFAGIGQNGSLTVGSLEMSNVDLAAEFTNLILAQRGFEASSQGIATSAQVLADLVNLIR